MTSRIKGFIKWQRVCCVITMQTRLWCFCEPRYKCKHKRAGVCMTFLGHTSHHFLPSIPGVPRCYTHTWMQILLWTKKALCSACPESWLVMPWRKRRNVTEILTRALLLAEFGTENNPLIHSFFVILACLYYQRSLESNQWRSWLCHKSNIGNSPLLMWIFANLPLLLVKWLL